MLTDYDIRLRGTVYSFDIDCIYDVLQLIYSLINIACVHIKTLQEYNQRIKHNHKLYNATYKTSLNNISLGLNTCPFQRSINCATLHVGFILTVIKQSS